MLVTLVQIDAWDAVAGAAVALRASSVDDAAACHLNGPTWWPAIAKLPTLRYDFFDGSFGGQISAPTSSITIQTEALPALTAPGMADARFRLWTGELGADWSGYTLRFDGRVSGQPQVEEGKAQVDFAVDDRWLDTALLSTYAGTTGAEGPASLKGQVKPLALGAPRYVAGTLIDAINSVFQVSAYGPVNGFEAALERLLRYGAPIADYATYDALVAASIPRGQWATAKSVGMARFGAPPTGQISFLLQGDAAGPDGWARKPGQLIRRLALLSGGAGKIDDASLNALDAARPYNLSLYLDAQTTARQLIQQIAASVNAVAGVSWTGKLFVRPVGISAPSITLATDGSSLPAAKPARQIDMGAPWKKLAIGAERAWTVHALADIAFTATLVDMGAYASTTTYREGNIVQSGGATWVYVNPAPSSGNAPPAPPSTGDAYWSVLAQAGTSGEDGASALTLVADTAQTSVAINKIWSDGATGWGLAHAHTVEGYSNGAVATWTVGPDGGKAWNMMAGLGQAQHSGNSYDSITFAIYRDDAGHTQAYINGNGLVLGPTVDRNSAARFKVHYDGLNVRFYVNDTPFYTYYWGRQPDTLYFVAALASTQPRIENITLSAAGPVGVDGTPGLNNATVTIYQRAASAPALPSAPTTYTFASGGLAGLNNGWGQSIPEGNNPLYASTAVASATTATASIAAASWSAARIIVKDGVSGASGTTVTMSRPAATVWAYANGSVVDWSPASGQVKVESGGVDVTASATFSAVTTTGMTGGINAAGAYSVTAMTTLTGTMTITVTYAGKTYTLQFGLTKQTGGYEIVAVLPTTDLFQGREVFLTTDEKLYRYSTATARWTTSVAAVDIAGQLADTQIAAVAASKVTGQLADSQLGSIAAAKLTGQITSTQITDGGITTPKIAAGSVTTARLAAGAVTANEIAANAITTGKIAAGAVTTALLAAGAVTTNELAAGAVVAGKIAAGTITANELATDSVTANKIAAGAVTAAKVAVTELSAITANIGLITAGRIWSSNGFTKIDLDNGTITFNNNIIMKVSGSGFGSSNQFIEWTGPSQASLSGCTEANAISYVKTNGQAYFGGTLSAGTLVNSRQTTSLYVDANVTTGVFGSNGRSRVVTVSYEFRASRPNSGTCPASPITPTITVELRRGTDASGAFIDSRTFTGTWYCERSSGPGEPGVIQENVTGSFSFTDNTGGTSAAFFTRIVSVSTNTYADTQKLSIISVEQ